MKKIKHIENKELAIYTRKNLLLMITNKLHSKNVKKSKSNVITLENIEALLIMLVI